MVIVFAVLLSLAAKAGLAGLPLAFILTSWFFKYAYILFDHTVRGVDEPPALDIQMVNPVNEQRPLAQLVILGLIYAAVKLAEVTGNPSLAAAIAIVAGVLLPASVAVLGLEGNIIKAVYPVALARMVIGLGRMYAVVLVVIVCCVMAVAGLAKLELWLPLQTVIGLFAVLSVFSVLGGALYQRRDALGLEAWHSPERTAQRLRNQELRQSERAVDDAYGQIRVGAHTNAWQMLQTWLRSRGDAPEDYRWLCERVTTWSDPRYLTRLTQEYVDRLLVLKHYGEALEVVAHRLAVDQDFRPKSAATTLQIAQIAAAGGGARVARTLLADFAVRFAGDRSVESANVLARQLQQ